MPNCGCTSGVGNGLTGRPTSLFNQFQSPQLASLISAAQQNPEVARYLSSMLGSTSPTGIRPIVGV